MWRIAGFNSVSVINTATNQVVATIPTSSDTPSNSTYPNEVAVTPDGTRAYATNNNPSTVSVINTATNQVVATIPVGAHPFAVAVTPDGTRAYVTICGFDPWTQLGSVSVIDTATNQVAATIPVGIDPAGIAVTPDGARAYVTNFFANSVSVIDTAPNSPAFNAVIATVPVGSNPKGVAVTPDGTRVYVTNFYANSVSVINTTTNQVVATIPVGGLPRGIALMPDGQRAYVESLGDSVSVIDTAPNSPAFNTVVATIPVSGGPYAIAITPDGKSVYVASVFSDTVSMIDTATQVVGNPIPVENQPSGIAITPVQPEPCEVIITGLTATPSVLWPPNHKMAPVTVTAYSEDSCGPEPLCKIVSVASNESIGSTDWALTGNLTVNLRAEREGKGSGRVYTLTVRCANDDDSAMGKVTVTVPHDQGKQK